MLRKLARHWRSLFAGRNGAPPSTNASVGHSDAALLSRDCIARARVLRERGEHRGALTEYQRATALTPENAQALAEQAAEHLAVGEREDARDCYELALAHAPDCVAALLGLSRMAREAGDASTAMQYVRHALQIAPDDAATHIEAALVHGRRGDVQSAIAAYTRALELNPDDAGSCSNLGLLYLSHVGDARQAQQYFERAIKLSPASVAAQANLGLALEEQGQVDAALHHYEKLIAAYPAENEYRWNRALALLVRGDYARGWEDYEMRNARAVGSAPREFPYPVWTGGMLRDGAALLVYGEQGLGDEIMFASCIPDLLARGINCVIECDLRLAGLFARAFPGANVHGAARDGDRSWLAEYPRIESQIAIGSLPRLLRRAAADFPAHTGYLQAEPQRIAQYRSRLARDSAGAKVGIAWRGGTPGTRGALRSIPLSELAPVFRTPGVTFINLQRGHGDALAEISELYGTSVLTLPDALNDVEEMAALLQAIDVVIVADSSLAHLAGALGVMTWIILPHGADWRWLRGQSTSPWYPSVRLCRQLAPGDWGSAIGPIVTELRLRG